jgi:hypothetical protein
VIVNDAIVGLSAANIVNAGTISSSDNRALDFVGSGLQINNSGVLFASQGAIVAGNSGNNIVNSGSITSQLNDGISATSGSAGTGSTIVNTATGVIDAFREGIELDGANHTVLNDGVISTEFGEGTKFLTLSTP